MKEENMSTTTEDWRELMSAHQFGDAGDSELPTAEEVRAVIRERIEEIKALAGALPDSLEFVWDAEGSEAPRPLDHARLEEMDHVLANLNCARLHLSDIDGR
jgi:hypothetical protein